MASGRERDIYRKSNIFGLAVVAVISVAIIVACFFGIKNVEAQNESYIQLESELESQITDESIRAEEIEEYSRYVDSDEFAEKTAREKYGLVYSDEIVLKEEE